MHKFKKYFLILAIPILSVLAVSCNDDLAEDTLVPEVTAVDPVEGVVGDEIIITGTGFDNVTDVRFGAVDVVNPIITPTQITATVPTGVPAGLQPISVISAEGTDTFDFTVL